MTASAQTFSTDHLPHSVNLSREEQLEFITQFLIRFERRIADWPTVAQMVLRVKQDELWRGSIYHSWTDWLTKVAPVSSRMIFLRLNLYEALKGDFTDEELSKIPIETAKHLREMSPQARRNPIVREAAKKKAKKFIAEVMENLPEQHLEHNVRYTVLLTATQEADREEIFEIFRTQEEAPEMKDGDVLHGLLLEWKQSL